MKTKLKHHLFSEADQELKMPVAAAASASLMLAKKKGDAGLYIP